MTVRGALVGSRNSAVCSGDGCFAAGGGFGGGGDLTVDGGTVMLNHNVAACDGAGCSLAGAGANIFGGASLTLRSGNIAISDNQSSCAGSGCASRAGGLTVNGVVRVDGGSLRIDRNTATANTQGGAPGLVRGAVMAISSVGSVAVGGSGTVAVMWNAASCQSARCHVQGGGISKVGALSLSNSPVIGNTASAPAGVAQGGGLFNAGGSASLTDSPVNRNTAAGESASGGGIFVAGGSVTLDDSPVRANTPDNCEPSSLC